RRRRSLPRPKKTTSANGSSGKSFPHEGVSNMRKLISAIVCFVLPLMLLAGEPGKLREIDAKDIKVDFEKGSVKMPKVVTSIEELDKAIPAAAAIKKQVDFGKDKLLVFAWGGSGGDKLGAKMSDDGKTV